MGGQRDNQKDRGKKETETDRQADTVKGCEGVTSKSRFRETYYWVLHSEITCLHLCAFTNFIANYMRLISAILQ